MNRTAIDNLCSLLPRDSYQWFWKGKGGVSGGLVKADKLHKIAEAAECKRNDMYITLNPTRPCGFRARREDVVGWEYILVDIDPLGERIEQPYQAAMELESVMGEICGGPGIYIDSGRGIQLWLRIQSIGIPENVEQSVSMLLRNINEKWNNRHDSCVDVVTGDLSRVARCPGTVNMKTMKEAKILFNTLGYIRGDDIIERFPPRVEERQEVVKVEDRSNLTALLPHLNGKAREFLLYGVGSPGRHTAAFATAMNLKELGFDFQETLDWVHVGARNCYRMMGFVKYNYPLSVEDVFRTVTSAYRRMDA